jgi:hypothetical protein
MIAPRHRVRRARRRAAPGRSLGDFVRRGLLLLRSAPPAVRVIATLGLTVLLWASLDLTYQVIRKPTELLFPVAGTLSKTPSETWRDYAPLFRDDSTETMTPDLLAALAQVEGDGNPVARTYWQWHLTWNPFELYRPASSAVGMYQITDGTFAEAKRYCIHDHVVAEAGHWNDWHACWFNNLYTRVVPSHAVEMTAALLDAEMTRVLKQRHGVHTTLSRRQNLAAVIHLCGPGGGDAYVRRGFAAGGERCGDQSVATYLARVNALKRQFSILAGASSTIGGTN